MASYVQYLNVGFGIFNNTQAIENWNIEGAMEEALLLDDPDTDIRIIGFRFFDKDAETGSLTKQSGIFYLSGEKVEEPKTDNEIVSYFKNMNRNFPMGEKMIKIRKPDLLVYPFRDGDRILDTTAVLAKINARKGQERLAKIRQGIEDYKQSIIDELEHIQQAIADNAFHLIPMSDSTEGKEVKHLNILNDDGDFNKHIEYLRKQRVEILNIENSIKGIK